MSGSSTESEEAARRAAWASPLVIVVVACLSLLGLAGIVTTAIVVVQNRNYTDCQRGYNADVVRALKERGSAGDQDRTALRMVTSSTVVLVDILLRSDSTVERR